MPTTARSQRSRSFRSSRSDTNLSRVSALSGTTSSCAQQPGHSGGAHHVHHASRPLGRRNKSHTKLSGLTRNRTTLGLGMTRQKSDVSVHSSRDGRSSRGSISDGAIDDEGDEDSGEDEVDKPDQADPEAEAELEKDSGKHAGTSRNPLSPDIDRSSDEDGEELVIRKGKTRGFAPPRKIDDAEVKTDEPNAAEAPARGRLPSVGGQDPKTRRSAGADVASQDKAEPERQGSTSSRGRSSSRGGDGSSSKSRDLSRDGSRSRSRTGGNEFKGFTKINQFNDRAKQRVDSTAHGLGLDTAEGSKNERPTSSKSANTTQAIGRRTSYPFPRIESDELPMVTAQQQTVSDQLQPPDSQEAQVLVESPAATLSATPPSETATLAASNPDITSAANRNPVTPLRASSSSQTPRSQARTPTQDRTTAGGGPSDDGTRSERGYSGEQGFQGASGHLRTRNSHTSLKSLASLRVALPPHPLSSPSSARHRVSSLRGAPPQITTDTAKGHWSSSSGAGTTTSFSSGSAMIPEEEAPSTSRLSNANRNLSSRSLVDTNAITRPSLSRGSTDAQSSLRKASFSSQYGDNYASSIQQSQGGGIGASGRQAASSGAMSSTTALRRAAEGSMTTGSSSGARISAHSAAQAAAKLPLTGTRPVTRGGPGNVVGTESINLVSRFVAIPTDTPGDVYSTAVGQDQTEDSLAVLSALPPSPFADSHASLLRILREGPAVYIPPGTPLSSLSSGVRGNLSLLASSSSGATGVGGGGYSNVNSGLTRGSTGLASSTSGGRLQLQPGRNATGGGGALGGTTGAAGHNSSSTNDTVVGDRGAVIWGLSPFEMSVYRCLEQRKGAVKLSTGAPLGPLPA